MPFPFSEICVYLSRLEDIELRNPPILLAAEKYAAIKAVTESWFKSHRRTINELSIESAVALISALLPERRTDRVYNIKVERLCNILRRGLHLSSIQVRDLEAHKSSGSGDLGTCLHRVLDAGGPPAAPRVYLDDVDDMLQLLAGYCQFSDRSAFKSPSGSPEARDNLVGNIFKRSQPSEAKWLVRLILKDLSPVRMNEAMVLKSFHFLLPDLLQFQNDYQAAIRLLKGPMKEYPECPDARSERLHRQSAWQSLRPVVNTKVGRPDFRKARSIDRCMSMLGTRQWVLERKYDGEYCEIHIDLRQSQNPTQCITIFSKNGKNSTADRKGIHQILVDCLQLGSPECKIKRQAIFLAEIVVYSDKEHQVVHFDEVWKHIPRSGRHIGTDMDSPPKPHEHLAIVFFDFLLLDDEIVMNKPIEERRNWLREVYRKIGGKAWSTEWKMVDFTDVEKAKKSLVQQFAASIAERCEGLVLKPCGLPYVSLRSSDSYIKLKKDYIAGLGDEADFAVVGGSYNAQQALKSGIPNLRWTEFHLGCLLNKADVQRFGARPHFKVVGTIQLEACIPKPVLEVVNSKGRFCAQPYSRDTAPTNFDIDVEKSPKMLTVFETPFVFEVIGSGFEKPSNCNYLMLRHARVKKLHEDRTWRDCISFQELQEQGTVARADPVDSESQDTRRWIQKLEAKSKKKFERQRTATPRTDKTDTPSTTGSVLSPLSSNVRMQKPRDPNVSSSPTKSDLDGTTIVAVEPTSSKRQRENAAYTPRPVAKRQCMRSPVIRIPEELVHDKGKQMTVELAGVVTDINNSSARPSTAQSEPTSAKKVRESKGILQTLSTLFRPTASSSPISQRSSVSNTPDKGMQRYQCEASRCLFSNTVLYLTPCIASTPYITENLLRPHNTTIIPTLAHWDRDSFSHLPLTETVAESQAYEDMAKIVLVESKRASVVKKMVKQVLGLNRGKWRERVEVWDWRVLEECVGHVCPLEARRQHFLGATLFDEGRESALFVTNVAWLKGLS